MVNPNSFFVLPPFINIESTRPDKPKYKSYRKKKVFVEKVLTRPTGDEILWTDGLGFKHWTTLDELKRVFMERAEQGLWEWPPEQKH
jgi:hypothetical protein